MATAHTLVKMREYTLLQLTFTLAKNRRQSINSFKLFWIRHRDLKTVFGHLKTNNFPVLLKGVKHAFPIKLFFKSDIRFPTSAYFNPSHERELIWLANHDLPAMSGISRDRSNHVTKQKLKSPRHFK